MENFMPSDNNELVSVCVLSYNNPFILETLDSVKRQTYKNIELLIIDDNSKEEFLFPIKNWILENKNSFINIKLIINNKNKGVTKNCNILCKQANGKFIKIIGDDILSPDYLQESINFFSKNPTCKLLFTKMSLLLPNSNFNFSQSFNYESLSFSSQMRFEQFKKTATLFHWPTPSAIYKKEILQKYNFFDEKFKMWEDGPFYYKLITNCEEISFINKELVIYRVLEKSLSNGFSKSSQITNALFYNKKLFIYDVKNKHIKAILKYLRNFLFLLFPFIIVLSPNFKDIKKNKSN